MTELLVSGDIITSATALRYSSMFFGSNCLDGDDIGSIFELHKQTCDVTEVLSIFNMQSVVSSV